MFIDEKNYFGKYTAEDLAKEYGTPLYVYNENVLRESMRDVSKIITSYPYRANFSMKANSNPEILKLVLDEGLNADAMSDNEIRILQYAGFPSDRIFFVPNNVSIDEIKFAVDNNIIVSLDSLDQLDLYGSYFPNTKCAVRINPGTGAGHHDKVVTAGKNTKFAIQESEIDGIFEIAEKYNLRICGINQHVGSLFMDPAPFLKATENLLRIAKKFKDLDFIDFGGGFGIPYRKLDGENRFDFDAFRDGFEKLISDFVKEYGKTPLFKTEPGRYCVAEGGVLLGRVHAVKNNSGKTYAGTDIGMNVLMRPVLYDSYHEVLVYRDGRYVEPSANDKEITVTGNICETGDIIAKERVLPEMQRGDLICVMDAGAYGYSMASNYNARLRPAEVLITKDGEARLIRRREKFTDLFNLFI